MTTESGLISGDDVLLIIEAMDHYIRYGQDPAPYERQDYDEFMRLSARLKQNMGLTWRGGGHHVAPPEDLFRLFRSWVMCISPSLAGKEKGRPFGPGPASYNHAERLRTSI